MRVDSEMVYRERAEAFLGQAAALKFRFDRIANLRLLAFVAAGVSLVWGTVQALPVVIALGVVLGVAFVVLVRYHRAVRLRRDRADALRAVNAEALERLGRRFQNVPLRHTRPPDAHHPYASDLDVFGYASLMHLLDTTRTSMGQARLADWLLQPASPSTIRERQPGVRELASQLEFRQNLEAGSSLDVTPRLDPEPLLAWAESPPQLLPHRGLVWASRTSAALLCLLIVAQATGLTAWPWWLVFVLVNAFLWQRIGGHAYATLAGIGTHADAFSQYAASFGLFSTAAFEAPLLKRLLGTLTADDRSAYAHMRRLERISQFILPRSALVYWVVQSVLLWDVHVLAALESWQAGAGAHLRTWLASLGEIEALAALAALAHAHPDWCMPDVDDTACRVDAQQAGHPLLAPEVRKDNDITLGPPGTFVLVTGSNMAGKSTYLRTIGTNVVLAQTGGPVCATAFHLPPLALCTSMRVVDSLDRGVSTFLAEVLRLKQVVDAARALEPGRTLCFLLDEIFQGTNTAERQIAARQVVRFLIARRTVGALSTHDLTLADTPEFFAPARPIHFTETLTAGPSGPIMTFDYRLRPGLAVSTNALRLVEMLGLDASQSSS